MRTNLSSQISLNRVSTRYYKPENTIERSVKSSARYRNVSVTVSFALLPQVLVRHFARCLRNWFADIRKKV